MDMLFTQAKQYSSKLTASHFGTLNTKFANQNVLEMIFIAMHNENKADCNENFRICGMPGFTYGHAVHASQTIFIKINCLTFWHPKYKICKPECAGKDFHCHAQ